MAEQVASKSSQDFVPIKEIRDGVVVLKDGSMRAILMTSSQNFALKSSDEQNAILFQFQNALNSLDFSIQIFVQSRRLDIRPYIALVEGKMKEQTSDLMRIQIREYVKFIKKFTEDVNIMTKTFFIVVPYTPPQITGVSKKGLSGLFGGGKTDRRAPNTA
jgi:type IV secretory pathway VirB4 component